MVNSAFKTSDASNSSTSRAAFLFAPAEGPITVILSIRIQLKNLPIDLLGLMTLDGNFIDSML